MPGRNVIKTYVKDGVYHVYNRGVEKRVIFQEKMDYKVFLDYLKEYLSPPGDSGLKQKTFTLQGSTFKGVPRQPKNYFGRIELLAYCLMPNHFHLLIRQADKDSLKLFLKSLLTRYSMYFNKKYSRVGPLFQGTYKAILVMDDNYLLHLSRYIHLNPGEFTNDIVNAYSSYAEYLLIRKTSWIKTNVILSYFDNRIVNPFIKFNSYKKFIEENGQNSGDILGKLGIDNDL